MFSSEKVAMDHADSAHSGAFRCPFAEVYGCGSTFDNIGSAHSHATALHSRFLCNVPLCVNVVMGHWMSYSGFRCHVRAHRVTERFSGDLEIPEPEKVVPGDEGWKEIFSRPTDDQDLPNCDESSAFAVDEAAGDDGDPLESEMEGCEIELAALALKTVEERRSSLRRRNQELLTS